MSAMVGWSLAQRRTYEARRRAEGDMVGGMGDPTRLDPLVVEAAAQVASCKVRLEYVEDQAKAYGTDPLPETLQQHLDEARNTLKHRQGMWRRLKEKAEAEAGPDN